MSYPRVFGCFDLKLHHMWLRDSMDWYCLLPSKQGQLWKIAHSKQECSLQMGLKLLGLKPADLPKQSLLAMYHSFIGSLQMNSPRQTERQTERQTHPNSHHPSHPVPSCPPSGVAQSFWRSTTAIFPATLDGSQLNWNAVLPLRKTTMPGTSWWMVPWGCWGTWNWDCWKLVSKRSDL